MSYTKEFTEFAKQATEQGWSVKFDESDPDHYVRFSRPCSKGGDFSFAVDPNDPQLPDEWKKIASRCISLYYESDGTTRERKNYLLEHEIAPAVLLQACIDGYQDDVHPIIAKDAKDSLLSDWLNMLTHNAARAAHPKVLAKDPAFRDALEAVRDN